LSTFRSAARWQLFILAFVVALLIPAVAQATPTWLSAINISDPGQDGFEPEVAVAPDGTVIAVWTRSDGTIFRVQSANRTPSGAWSTAQTISDANAAASGPDIAIDSSGNAISAWTQSDGTNLRIRAAFKPAGSNFQTDVPVSAAGQDASAPDVSFDNAGNALVTWQRSDGTNLRVQAAIRTPGPSGTFGAVSTLSPSGQDAFEPRAAAGPSVDSNGVVVWTRSDGTNLRVQSSRRRDVVGYARPKGATPTRLSLVPAFNQCLTPNRVHGAPLASGSCAPPQQASSILTIGTPDAPGNGQAANFSGSVRYSNLSSDVKLDASMTDVRNNPSLTDYTGNLRVSTNLQITDQLNSAETPEPGTVQTFKYTFDVPCTTTASTSIGSTCSVSTTANTLVPGTVVSGFRSIWALGQVEVKDPGPDGIFNSPSPTPDDGTFARQGVYVP
jgi:hypothetical protein